MRTTSLDLSSPTTCNMSREAATGHARGSTRGTMGRCAHAGGASEPVVCGRADWRRFAPVARLDQGGASAMSSEWKTRPWVAAFVRVARGEGSSPMRDARTTNYDERRGLSYGKASHARRHVIHGSAVASGENGARSERTGTNGSRMYYIIYVSGGKKKKKKKKKKRKEKRGVGKMWRWFFI